MSVYIPGMEMPTSCSNCVLCACYKESKGEVYRCDITMRPVKYFEVRLDNCPLVPVPPHGRLGDLDKLAFNVMDASTADQALAMIDDAPTIIPADKEGMEHEMASDKHYLSSYCPNCGAKMDKEVGE